MIADMFAGLILGKFSSYLVYISGLLILIPGAIAMRGNVFASLGSRLGTNLHLGLISSTKSKVLLQNIGSSIILTILMSVYLGFIAAALCVPLGISADIRYLVIISTVGGLIAAILLIATSIAISYGSFNYGWDPDNVSVPVITAIGDLVTIPCLFIGVWVVLRCEVNILFYLFLALTVVSLVSVKSEIVKKIIYQSAPVFALAGLISTIAGLVLHTNFESFIDLPGLLILIPPLWGIGGSLGCILAARLSTSLHVGIIQPKLKPDKSISSDLAAIYVVTIVIFTVLGGLSHFICLLADLPSSFMAILLTSILSGLILVSILVAVVYYVTILSFRIGLDPDNVVIPSITSLVDVLGIVILAKVLILLGLIG